MLVLLLTMEAEFAYWVAGGGGGLCTSSLKQLFKFPPVRVFFLFRPDTVVIQAFGGKKLKRLNFRVRIPRWIHLFTFLPIPVVLEYHNS